MAKNVIRTHRRIASLASKALKSSKSSKSVKSIAGDALVNRKRNSKRG